MTLTIPISPDAERRLRKCAEAAGVDERTYAAKLLEERLLEPDTLQSISGETAARFRATGMTEEQLSELLEREKHAEREARLGVRFSAI